MCCCPSQCNLYRAPTGKWSPPSWLRWRLFLEIHNCEYFPSSWRTAPCRFAKISDNANRLIIIFGTPKPIPHPNIGFSVCPIVALPTSSWFLILLRFVFSSVILPTCPHSSAVSISSMIRDWFFCNRAFIIPLISLINRLVSDRLSCERPSLKFFTRSRILPSTSASGIFSGASISACIKYPQAWHSSCFYNLAMPHHCRLTSTHTSATLATSSFWSHPCFDASSSPSHGFDVSVLSPVEYRIASYGPLVTRLLWSAQSVGHRFPRWSVCLLGSSISSISTIISTVLFHTTFPHSDNRRIPFYISLVTPVNPNSSCRSSSESSPSILSTHSILFSLLWPS